MACVEVGFHRLGLHKDALTSFFLFCLLFIPVHVVKTQEDESYMFLLSSHCLLFLVGLGAVAINAVFMQTYVGGVSCPFICSKRQDHGVLLVGYGAAGLAPIRMKEKPYWIIKNSWGPTWGEKGYYKICRGRNICGVDSMVSTVAAVHSNSH